MIRDTADYEESEEIAIQTGKVALSRAPWLHNRRVPNTGGFFAELRQNDAVHPNYYSVHCVDGNGTKLFLSPWSGNYRLAPTDGVAMNANDMAPLIHAYPASLDLYLACQTGVEDQYMGEIMSGFVDALERIRIPNAPWNVNIGKIETASLDEMISLGVPNRGLDFGIVLTGFIDKDKVPNLDPQPGHVIVGVSSTGLHSNGYTGARHVLFTPDVEYRDEWKTQYRGKFRLDDKPDILRGQTVLEALQVPTALYLVETALIGQQFDNRDIYGVNITGNGLANFNRAGRGVSFEITDPLPHLPIHELLVQESGWTPEQAYTKQNMGMGFAYVAPNLDVAEGIVGLVNGRAENRAYIVGEVRKSDEEELRTIIHRPYEGGPISFVGYSN
jgi:phosphoribosylformylglycinamidine cyclo-ligase